MVHHDVRVGDRAVLRKPHPCGSFEWDVLRIGADIGLKCLGCGHRVMLTRRAFNRSVKRIIPREHLSSADDSSPPGEP
jgi:hypothetical protein